MDEEIRPKALMIPFDKFRILDILEPSQYKNTVTKMRCYVELGEEPEGLEPIEQMAFEALRPFMDENIKTYQRTIIAHREAGKKGGRPRKEENQEKPNGFPEKPNETNSPLKYKVQSTKDTDTNVSDRGNASASPSSTKTPRFQPPELEEVKAYFTEKGGTAEQAERFRDYYESNGWKVGKNPMRKWKAAASGWMARDREQKKPASAPLRKPFMASRSPEEAAAHPNDFLKDATRRRSLRKKGETDHAEVQGDP